MMLAGVASSKAKVFPVLNTTKITINKHYVTLSHMLSILHQALHHYHTYLNSGLWIWC